MSNLNQSTKFWIDYTRQNELNLPTRSIGQKDLLAKNIYNSFHHFADYDPTNTSLSFKSHQHKYRKNHGPIYDLCFSLDGKQLIAATEESALLFFDPLNHQLINQLDDAHENSINYIKFLDSNLFATASNDKTIAIFDLRNTRNRLKTLSGGHTHFIKNIEYDPKLRYLISSAFDGQVICWDIFNNSSSDYLETGWTRIRQQDCPFKKVLSLNCLMRMRMTTDHTKMILSTVEGYIMLIHDLDITNLNQDLCDFQSDLYRLMQKKHSSGFDFGSWMNSLFKSKRNRVELISDFPADNEAHLIGSIDVHPHGWCLLSRNLSRDENSEWTVIHDIQDYEKPNEMMYIEMPKTESIYFPLFPHSMYKNSSSRQINESSQNESSEQETQRQQSITDQSQQSNYNDRSVPIMENDEHNQSTTNDESSSINPNDIHISPLIYIISPRSSRRAQATILNSSTSYRQIKPGNHPPKIYKNLDRMTHYIEELNVYKLFFKEVHFSQCGRFLLSPYGNGFRLLSFNNECTELSDQMLSTNFQRPQSLNPLNIYSNHSNYVTTAVFSPTHDLITAGCLSGQVSFYQPVL